jgi:putative toxin-antitoxin system antitoxin component (TIGR02293 family)
MPLVHEGNKQKIKSERKTFSSSSKKKTIKSEALFLSPDTILKKYRQFFIDDNSIITNAQKGVEISAVNDFALVSAKSQKEIAELIHTTAKTLQNYNSGSKRLPTLQSELLLKLYALYAKGLEIFDGAKNFNSWLQKSAFGLYNDVPNDLLHTSTGINLVMDELIRIEFGDLA